MANEITESLFKSIDTIIASRLEGLPYDLTLKCVITDAANASIGQYTVSYNGNNFTAYSERSDLKSGDAVYVSAMKNDYTCEKAIIGKVINEDTYKETVITSNDYVKVKSLTIDNTNDFYITPNGGDKSNSESTTVIYSYDMDYTNRRVAGYDLLRVKASFSANLPTVTEGTYGLKITLTYYDLSESIKSIDSMIKDNDADVVTYYLSPEDMISSNIYSTAGYCNQEKIIDISDKVIIGIKVFLYLNNDFITSSATRLTNSTNKIYATNLQIDFGYDKEYFDDDIKLKIYTYDGYRYNYDNKIKTLYLRLLLLSSTGNTATDISDVDNLEYLFWNYDAQTTYATAPLNKNYYVYNCSDNPASITFLALKSTEIESIVGLAIDSRTSTDETYTTEELIFYNNDYIESSETLDLIQGLSISFLSSECGGVYNLYGKSGELMGADTQYHLVIDYNSSVSGRKLEAGDVISWSIPNIRTMIEVPQLNIDYESRDTITQTLDEESTSDTYGQTLKYTITRTLTASDIRPDGTFLIPFTIKDTYYLDYTNNDIDIVLTINSIKYEKSISLSFGTSGSLEAEYLFSLYLTSKSDEKYRTIHALNYSSTTDEYYVFPKLRDYLGNDIEISDISDITLSWINNSSNHLVCTENVNKWKISINKPSVDSIENYGYDVLVAQLTYNSYELKAYLPIAIKANSDYNILLGPTTITYDITGKKATYQKLLYLLKPEYSSVEILQWKYNTSDELIGAIGWPKLEDGLLIPTSIYYKEILVASVKCVTKKLLTNTETTVWVQPIVILLNKYPSAMYSGEGNLLSLTNSDNSDIIELTMVGRITGTNSSGLSGVFMGLLKDNSTSTMGLYGYRNGTKMFCLDENGVLYLNGSANDSSVADAENMLIKNSTFENCTLSGSNNISITGTITAASFTGNLIGNADTATSATTAADYSSSGTIATAIANLQSQIDNLLQQINNLS